MRLWNYTNGKIKKPQTADHRRGASGRKNMAHEGVRKKAYENTVYINFDSNRRMSELFSVDLNIDRIILGLELYAEKRLILRTLLLSLMRCRRSLRLFQVLNISMRMRRNTTYYARDHYWALLCMREPPFLWVRWNFSDFIRYPSRKS